MRLAALLLKGEEDEKKAYISDMHTYEINIHAMQIASTFEDSAPACTAVSTKLTPRIERGIFLVHPPSVAADVLPAYRRRILAGDQRIHASLMPAAASSFALEKRDANPEGGRGWGLSTVMNRIWW